MAHRAGLDPILYVSSIVALLPPGGQTLTPDSPAGHPPGPYLGSKAEAERVARRYQEAGAPVVITYPGSVFGPDDPHLGDGLRRVRNILKGRYPIAPSGGYPIVDVRDVAAVNAAVLEPARGARRYVAGGTFLRFADLVARLGGGGRPPAGGRDRAGRDAAACWAGGPACPAHRAGPYPGGVRGHLFLPVRGPL